VNTRSLALRSTPLLLIAALAAGCGGGGTGSSAQSTTASTTAAAPSDTASDSTTTGANALVAEAQQTAAGDVPDNQVFITFRNSAEGYAIKYPEGWAQRNSAGRVTFRDKNNLVRIEVVKGSATTVADATAELAQLRRQTLSLHFDTPTRTTVGGMRVVKVVYTTESAPNPVTGKRVKLVVDRYYVAGAGKHAVVDLGTPESVDNLDAYKLMIESFRWN
jgi:hypothetical protein